MAEGASATRPPGQAAWATRIRRLRGVDQMYLALETPVTPMHFGALVILDGRTLVDPAGRLRLAALRAQIDARLADVPELRRRIRHPGPLAGAPLWTDDPDPRIERHVGEFRLPSGVDDEDALFRSIERLMAPPLDRSHPLWRVWFVTGLPDGRVALLFEVHHAMADGLSAMRLARALLTDGAADGMRRPPAATTSPPWPELVIDNVRRVSADARRLNTPATRRALRAAARSFRDGAAATRHEPRTGLNDQVGPRRWLAVQRLDARTARRVAKTHGGGANDVVLALVAGGLRAMIASRGVPLERLAPRAGIAVGLPPSARGEDAGNHFGSYVIALPIAEADPAARVRALARDRAHTKATQDVSGVTGVRVWTNRFPPTRAFMAHQHYINVMEALIPGPPRPIELLGAPVVDLIPIQPLGRNVGLTFLASTYAGRLTIAVRADPDRFPDLDILLRAMEDDWAALSATARSAAALVPQPGAQPAVAAPRGVGRQARPAAALALETGPPSSTT
jgi:WS/DGAT/MGAT family acyltransferase